MAKKLLFIHVHIVKCGGTTFQEILKRNFTRPRAYYRENPIILHDHNAKDIERTIIMAPWLEALSSHHVSLDLPFYLDDLQIVAICFIRDPVDRFISHYFFHHHAPELGLQTVPIAKSLSLREYIEYGLVEGNAKPYKNGQIWHLMRSDDKANIEKIMELIDKRHLLLFPLARFDEACVVLEKLFPNHFKDCSYTIKNVGKKDQLISSQDRKLMQNHVNITDYKLLELSEQFLDNIMRDIFNTPVDIQKTIENFRTRNEILSMKPTMKTNGKKKMLNVIRHVLPVRVKNFLKQLCEF